MKIVFLQNKHITPSNHVAFHREGVRADKKTHSLINVSER